MIDANAPRYVPGIDDFAGVSSFQWEASTGRTVYSRAALDLHGLTQATLLEQFHQMVHPEDLLRVEALTTSFLEQGGSHSFEYRILRSDGGVRDLFCHIEVEKTKRDGLCSVRGLFVDVTGGGPHRIGNSTTQTTAFGFYDYDVARGTTRGSPELRRLLGLDGRHLTQARLRESTHPDDRAMVDRMAEGVLHTAGPFDFCFRICTPQGQVRWVRDRGEAHAPVDPETGRVRRVTGTLTDVTDHVGAKDPFVADPETFWSLIDRAPFGVFAVDADFRIVRMSSGGLPTFQGIDPLIGRDLGEVLHILWPDPFATEVIAHFRHTLETGESFRAGPFAETRNDRKSLESYDWGMDRVRLADGQLGVICHFYDLTERVRHEIELAEREQRLQLAYQVGEMGAWDVNLATGRSTWAPQLYRMFGASEDTADPAELWARSLHSDDLEPVTAAFDAAMAGGAPFDVDFRIVLPDGEVRDMASRGELFMDAEGRPERMSGVNIDVTDRKMAEHVLQDSEHRLRIVLDSLNAFVAVLDVDGTLREVNKPALDVADVASGEVLGRPFWETPWWDGNPDRVRRLQDGLRRARAGERVSYDEVASVKDDRAISVALMLSPVLDAHGNVQMIVASGFDISEREKAQARVQSLMGEVNHRAKNMLTLVQVVARQSARGNREGFLDRFQKRLIALGNAQDLLLQGTSDRVDLADLVQSQIGHFHDLVGTRICLSGPQVKLGRIAAQAIGMAVHELSTNAGKYGALSTDNGRIDITWRLKRCAGEERQFHMSWVERDGPPVAQPDHKGFGSAVIKDMAEAELGAQVRLEHAASGLTWDLWCPADALGNG